MGRENVNVITLKPKWSVRDLFTHRDQTENRSRILNQLDGDYLSKGWLLKDDIIWGRDYGFAVVKLGRRQDN